MTMSIAHTNPRTSAPNALQENSNAIVRTCLEAAGFAALFCWTLLREGYIGGNGATLYNYLPYTAIAQTVALVSLGFIGVRMRRLFAPRAAAVACALLGCAAGFVCFAAPSPVSSVPLNVLGAALLGACQGVLGVLWGSRLYVQKMRRAALILCSGMLAAIFLAQLCVCFGGPLCSILGTVLPLVSGCALIPHAKADRGNDPLGTHLGTRPGDAAAKTSNTVSRTPKALQLPALLLLGGAAQTSAFFAGVMSFPFALQSESIMHYWLLLSFAVFAVGVVAYIRRQRAASSLILLAALGMLFVGLFLLHARILGSVIFPLGLILAGRTCCEGLAWLTTVSLARTHRHQAVSILSFGALALNGTVGCALGVLANNCLSISFNDITLGASLVSLLFLAAFLLIETQRTLTPGGSIPVGKSAREEWREQMAKGTSATSRFATSRSKDRPLSQGSQPSVPKTAQASERKVVPLNQADALIPVDPEQLAQNAQRNAPGKAHQTPAERWANGFRIALAPAVEEYLDGLDLTSDEHDVAALICERATYDQIAVTTHVSLRTVKYRAGALYKKANVANRRAFEQLIRDMEA